MGDYDLDALASEPLTIRHCGEAYVIDLNMETLKKLDRARQSGPDTDQWELMETIMEAAGMPRAVFGKLNTRQATGLVGAITNHFLLETAAEGERTVN